MFQPFSRPTKIKPRRKYLTTHAVRILESQVTTRPKIESRFKFVSRKPFLRSTPRPLGTTMKIKADQVSDSSNQNSMEEDYKNEKTTELVDIALALQSIQSAPLPAATHEAKINIPESPQRFVFRSKPTKAVTPAPKRHKTDSTRSRVRYSTTSSPISSTTFRLTPKSAHTQTFEKIVIAPSQIRYQPTPSPDYYDNYRTSYLGQIPEHSKVLIHSNGIIECLDQGSFPHPVSCKKFISCARMENGNLLGWEYTCPKNLSFDPIGGICNWSTEVGCNE